MRTILPINEGWNFEKQGETSRVDLPHCWNDVDGQEGADYYRGECVYTRALPKTSGITWLGNRRGQFGGFRVGQRENGRNA